MQAAARWIGTGITGAELKALWYDVVSPEAQAKWRAEQRALKKGGKRGDKRDWEKLLRENARLRNRVNEMEMFLARHDRVVMNEKAACPVYQNANYVCRTIWITTRFLCEIATLSCLSTKNLSVLERSCVSTPPGHLIHTQTCYTFQLHQRAW